MDIKCNTYPYYNRNIYLTPQCADAIRFEGRSSCSRVVKSMKAGIGADRFEKRPVATVDATGLFRSVRQYFSNYKKNIIHTYEHKIVYALVEKELFGKNSMNSVTHDADKMILYIFGFPRSFVSRFHREHSHHHTESGKVMNLASMLCDNIASSPYFKPEKKYTLREYYKKSKEFQNLAGFKELLEKYNYGESLKFEEINNKKNLKMKSMKEVVRTIVSTFEYLMISFVVR